MRTFRYLTGLLAVAARTTVTLTLTTRTLLGGHAVHDLQVIVLPPGQVP